MTVQTTDANHTSTGGDLTKYGPILGVAIEYEDVCYRLPAPNRHHDVLRMMYDKGVRIQGHDYQGFYSAKCTFMTRWFALEVAKACNQLITKTPPEDELFSEDLW